MQAFARMTLPVRRVWNGVTARIGVRKRGKSQFPTNHLMLKMGNEASEGCQVVRVRGCASDVGDAEPNPSGNQSDSVPSKKKENSVQLLGLGRASLFPLSNRLKHTCGFQLYLTIKEEKKRRERGISL
ncbi:hypothetical protein F3Y22_tig00111210pilonHSYRG00217 [Hibiscus syriacus]|uniref:Uncharacterized protein n=1 Tax=Hibiscus syriacus TaxID=106335 RepID=A0A6A2YV89_HIBSY|nr:hypothetical protein F3Y22_tig00111210pilonHSYRG00217 [Hibiscus syriacus]